MTVFMPGRPCIIEDSDCAGRDHKEWKEGFPSVRRGFGCAKFCKGHMSCYDTFLQLSDQTMNSIWQTTDLNWEWSY